MKHVKSRYFLFFAMALILSLSIPSFAAVSDSGFVDVSTDAWYADAASYCQEHNLMGGTTATTFTPDDSMTRAMLATVLYRLAGEPTVSGSLSFTDVIEDTWYSDAILWASQNEIINGYGSNLFGANDPVTREQIATILWRYSGSPTTDNDATFTDGAAIFPWSSVAVNWAFTNGYMNGVEANRFEPNSSATRAQVATILMRYHQGKQSSQHTEPTPETENKILIAYFSATGNTENIANHLATILNADLYEIEPEVPYTSADLNYHDANSRSQLEQQDDSARPAIANSVANIADYKVIFWGYPIWNGRAPKIINTFLEQYDLSDKTIIPFCTSGSSSIGSSATSLQPLAPTADWLSGQRFNGSDSQATVTSWVEGLELPSLDTALDKREDTSAATRIRLSFDGKEAIITLNDNATSKDFLTMLPATFIFQDYASSEKISYLSRALSSQEQASIYEPTVGDVALYEPWQNLAIFYRAGAASSGLIPMGHVESGLDQLAAMAGQFEVSVTIIE